MPKTKTRRYTTKKQRMRKLIFEIALLSCGVYFCFGIIFQIGLGVYHFLFDFPEPTIMEVNYKKKEEPKFEFIELTTNKPSVEVQIREIAKEHNFQWPDYLIRLAMCESSLNPQAVGDDGKSRGLFQIHSGYHPEVSDAEAKNIKFATEWTMAKINQGKQHLWVCDRIIKYNK